MATVAVSHNGFQSEEVVPFGARIHASSPTETEVLEPELSREIDVAARLLCALSTHASLREAMMSYHAEFPEPKAQTWTEQVLRRMDTLLDPSIASDLHRTYDYNTPWVKPLGATAEEKPSILSRLALPAVVTVGAAMFAMFVVGVVTTYHYLLAR